MAVANGTATTPALRWAVRLAGALEATWLLTAALVPLIFVPTGFMSSEAVNAYVEVPKTTALRLLAGVMVILWIVEWLVKGGLSRPPQMSGWLARLQPWLVEQPSRWIVAAATIYVAATVITTALSQSFFISLWGEVSGQFGYSLYTTLSYFVLFAVIVTHLKTRRQLYRLLTVLVAAGFLVAVYGIVQRYEGDLLNVGEAGSVRVASTMANPVFTGAALVGTTTLSLGLARALLGSRDVTSGRAAAAVLLALVVGAGHLLAVWFTDSRGSWLIGVPAGLVALLALPAVFDALESMVRRRSLPADLLLLTCFIVVLTAAVLAAQLDVIGIEDFAGASMVRALAALVGVLAFLSVLVAMFPARFSEGVRDFGRSFLLLGPVLMVALLVVTYTSSPAGTVKLAFRDLAFLDARVLLAIFGSVGLLGLLLLAIREPRALLDAPDRWREGPPQAPRGSGRVLGGRRVRLGAVLRNAGMVLIGAARPLPAWWDGRREQAVKTVRVAVVLASMVVIALLAGGLVTTVSQGAGADIRYTSLGEAEAAGGVTAADPQGRGLSFRNDIWAASWRLVRDRPWFEYEDLSYSLARPLIGYGPELFKYTFPLENPSGGLLSQAHNFFVHHFVEQGILGGFASIGLVLSFFAVGAAQLWRSREGYSAAHRWILIALMATMAGRVSEMMVGVARESDLVTFWVLLAILVVLPSVMRPSQPAAAAPGRCPTCGEEHEAQASSCPRCGGPLRVPVAAEVERGTRRRERRARRQRERSAGNAAGRGAVVSPLRVLVLGVMSLVIVFVGWLSWDKNVDYAWAATIAGSAGDKLSEGDLRAGHRLMAQAIAKAPDVPAYYHNLSRVYDGYRELVTRTQGDSQSCEAFFSLEPREGRSQVADGTFAGCAEESYLISRRGFLKNKDSAQNKLVLANSAMALALLGYQGLDDEALRYYEELTDMLPKSWRQEYLLRQSQVRLGRYQHALEGSGETMAKARGPEERAQSLYLKGLAHHRLEDLDGALAALYGSLEADGTGALAADVHRLISAVYTELGNADAAAEHSKLSRELEQG